MLTRSRPLIAGFTSLTIVLALGSFAFAQSSIFDGQTLTGWTNQKGGPAGDAWTVEDGAIHLTPGQGKGGNIVTEQLYGDFELTFQWKIAENGNSGIKYRVKEFDNRVLGCEYQILHDEGHNDGKTRKRSTGSLYDVYEPSVDRYTRPIGEYNDARIVVCGNRLEHWLNGNLLLVAYVGTMDWYEKKEASKFRNVDGFGENRFGKIMLTDHNSEVWYRDLQLTPLYCTLPSDQFVSGRRTNTRRFTRRNRRRCR